MTQHEWFCRDEDAAGAGEGADRPVARGGRTGCGGGFGRASGAARGKRAGVGFSAGGVFAADGGGGRGGAQGAIRSVSDLSAVDRENARCAGFLGQVPGWGGKGGALAVAALGRGVFGI